MSSKTLYLPVVIIIACGFFLLCRTVIRIWTMQTVNLYSNTTDFRNLFGYHGKFENRSHNSPRLCVVLAGYKTYLLPVTLGRIRAFAVNQMDICLISSGLYSSELSRVASVNGWSYLSIRENLICLALNVAIGLHPQANLIFKLDEDIFITERYFENMLAAYHHAQEGPYYPSIMAPMITVNLYSSFLILKHFDKLDDYERLFEKPKLPLPQARTNPEVAKFFWGEGNYLPPLDIMNKHVSSKPLKETPCPFRFSIGAILFERQFWIDMGYFKVVRTGYPLGRDEEQITTFCAMEQKPVMLSENVVVGHFSYYPQTEEMKRFFKARQDLFVFDN